MNCSSGADAVPYGIYSFTSPRSTVYLSLHRPQQTLNPQDFIFSLAPEPKENKAIDYLLEQLDNTLLTRQ